MIDTHTHPYLPEFEDGGDSAVENALRAGVTHIVLPNVDASSVEPMMRLHARYPEQTSVAIGLHPTEVDEGWEEVVDSFERLLDRSHDFKAIGEVGIDLYWDTSRRDNQIDAFARQLQIAVKHRLPVIIHNRDGLAETLSAIRQVRPDVPLVFHSFTGSSEDVAAIRQVCDPYFGINGVVTFKNAGQLRESLPVIGLDRILLETDAPYLAPVPFRGKRNEPANIPLICKKVAETLGVSSDEVADATTFNAKKIFKI